MYIDRYKNVKISVFTILDQVIQHSFLEGVTKEYDIDTRILNYSKEALIQCMFM